MQSSINLYKTRSCNGFLFFLLSFYALGFPSFFYYVLIISRTFSEPCYGAFILPHSPTMSIFFLSPYSQRVYARPRPRFLGMSSKKAPNQKERGAGFLRAFYLTGIYPSHEHCQLAQYEKQSLHSLSYLISN